LLVGPAKRGKLTVYVNLPLPIENPFGFF